VRGVRREETKILTVSGSIATLGRLAGGGRWPLPLPPPPPYSWLLSSSSSQEERRGLLPRAVWLLVPVCSLVEIAAGGPHTLEVKGYDMLDCSITVRRLDIGRGRAS
jgi:hypothetical protein